MRNEFTLQKQILDRIKTQNVRPVPKGVFKAKDLVLWALLGVFVAALSVGFGMIIFMAKGADLALFERLGLSPSQKLAYSIPYFWIAATMVLGGIAFANYRKTRGGYRTKAAKFWLISAGIAIALGSTIYALDIPRYVDTAAANIPLYNAVVPLNTNVWLDPERGLLSGTVRERDSNESFTLRDADQVLWTVTGSDISMPEGFEFRAGDQIKIIGRKTGEDMFEAIEIMPR